MYRCKTSELARLSDVSGMYANFKSGSLRSQQVLLGQKSRQRIES
jgi:hypothetical protein